MAAASFELEVTTPEKLVIQATCTEAQIPGSEGELGILPGHAPLLSTLTSGALRYTTTDGRHEVLAIHGGWVEVQQTLVRVLTDAAENPEAIDRARAEESLKRAQSRLSHVVENVDFARALNAMKRAEVRVQVAKK
jgi:F-type H+-transporting ATPase subunit epsilon